MPEPIPQMPSAPCPGRRGRARPPRLRRAARVVALCVLVAAPAMSRAVAAMPQWTVVPAKSRIGFEYVSNGKPAAGRFHRFSGQGLFPPGAPDKATFDLHIKSGSIDLGDSRASAFATSAEWFDTANHPDVVYRLLKLTPIDGNRYRADGELTIRGKSKPVTTTLTLDVGAQTAHASGTLRIDRTDYGLGVGPMSLFVNIGREVAVSFDFVAHRVH